AAHVPAARVRRIEETLAEPQTATRSAIGSYGAPVGSGGPDRLPVAGFTYTHGGPELAGPPPGFGEHNREVLAEVGVGDAEFEQLKAAGIVAG
ncbi:MAG: CoA transferase, partial [Rhodobacteraceae bacterium]|nr:CoA transferase [Paracoccaceae bacterium]